MPGKVAIRWCSLPSKTRQSYCNNARGGIHVISLHDDTYHFVRHNNKIEFLRECGDGFKFFPGKNLADRVVRSVYDNYLSAWCNSTTCGWIKWFNHQAPGTNITYRSSSKSIVQSLLVGFSSDWAGGCNGTYTGVPPLNTIDGRYWSKKGSNIMTSSPCSKNAVKTEYSPTSC